MVIYRSLEQWIRGEHSDQPSCDDQVITAYWFVDNDITEISEKKERTSFVKEQLEHRLHHKVSRVLSNLEEIDVLVLIEPAGSGGCILHERTEERFFEPAKKEYVPYLDEEVSRFIEDMHTQEQESEDEQPLPATDGGAEDSEEPKPTLRSVAASELEVVPSAVEEVLTQRQDQFERMDDFDGVIASIKASEEVARGGEYDQMGWRNFANKWTLSRQAARMEQNEALV